MARLGRTRVERRGPDTTSITLVLLGVSVAAFGFAAALIDDVEATLLAAAEDVPSGSSAPMDEGGLVERPWHRQDVRNVTRAA